MLGFYFVFVLATSYSLCIANEDSQQECKKLEREVCDFNKYPKKIPTTVDELRKICRDVEELIDCILPVREKFSNNSGDIKYLRHLLDYIHDTCREDSEIFKVISSKLACLRYAARDINVKCERFPVSNSTQKIIQDMEELHFKNSPREKRDNDSSCLDSLWFRSCRSIKARVNCGFDVGDAVQDILSQFHYNARCTEEFISEITPKFEVIKSALMREEMLKKMEDWLRNPLNKIVVEDGWLRNDSYPEI